MRGLIQERTQAGLKAARARGRNGGRPRKMTTAKIKPAKILAADSSMTVAEICLLPGNFTRHLLPIRNLGEKKEFVSACDVKSIYLPTWPSFILVISYSSAPESDRRGVNQFRR